MQAQLATYLKTNKEIIENELSKQIEKLEIPKQLKAAMDYSLQAGGKRIRPILLLASFEIYNKDYTKALSTAAALEMIHTYSLIHDDLPAMDNDDYRRGKLTNHKQFDEATAILAGDALLTYSFELIANETLLSETEKVQIISKLASASGPKGMVGGQILDIEAEKNAAPLEQLEIIHDHKTGELLKFAVYAGAFLAGASKEKIDELVNFAYYLGLIFQVQDDILDVTGTEQKMGKPIGSDEDKEKSTYPKLLGVEGAIEKKEVYVLKAKEALEKADATDSNLQLLLDYVSNRDH
ncbi:polyprenyl synthetase family protein [Oceanobacillus sp. CAU 1775]